MYLFSIHREERNVWRIYLDRGDFDLAQRYSLGDECKLDEVLTRRAADLFAKGEYVAPFLVLFDVRRHKTSTQEWNGGISVRGFDSETPPHIEPPEAGLFSCASSAWTVGSGSTVISAPLSSMPRPPTACALSTTDSL